MRWVESFVHEAYGQLRNLGLSGCPVCQLDQLHISSFPNVILLGGLPPKITKIPDPDTNIEYFVRVECQTCGHAMFFNAEKFRTGDEPIMRRSEVPE